MRAIPAFILLVASAGVVLDSNAGAAAPGRAVPVERDAAECALHLSLPASWTTQEAHEDGACVVTASNPGQARHCDSLDDEKQRCDAPRQAIVSIRAGSIDTMQNGTREDKSPFEFSAGKWSYHDDWNEHEASQLPQAQRRILYADYATREYFEDGSYCCVGRNWWALVDLPGHRVALVNLTWDFIAWDSDTTSWDDATDAKAKTNLENFLRALR